MVSAEIKSDSDEFSEVPKPASWYGVRHTQMLLLFGLIIIGYGMRVNLSVGIVAMTDPEANPDFPTYNWTIKSTILSSFFWGYVLPQIGVGQLAERYGPRWLLTGSMAVSSLFTILIPPMAEVGAWGVMFCRVIQGFTQGFFFPCMHHMLSKWIPLKERSRMGTFIYAGGPLGTVIAMPVTGWISASSIGWPSAFYIYGALGFVWTAIWLFMGANGPTEHKRISEEEKNYILKSSGQTTEQKRIPTPWKALSKSPALWAILIAHCGQNWGFWTLLTEIPTYMKGVLEFDIASNGLLSAAPYFALWVLSFIFGYLTDFVINKNILSIAVARKIASAIGLFGPAAALFALGLINNASRGEALGLLICAVGLNSAIFSGHQVNHIDIAPSHAGTLMGITNGFANILGIVAPLLVQFIVTDEEDEGQWQIVWFISAAVYVCGDVVFTLFGRGERQYWDPVEPADCDDNGKDVDKEKAAEAAK